MAHKSLTVAPDYDTRLLKTAIYNSLNKYYILFYPIPDSCVMYKLLGIMKYPDFV